MLFICLTCPNLAEFPDSEPEHWDYNRRYAAEGLYRHICPDCGSAMAANSSLPCENGLKVPGWMSFHMFSLCPNAGRCAFKSYTPECEHQILRPACLARFHDDLTVLMTRLDYIEERLGIPSFPSDQSEG